MEIDPSSDMRELWQSQKRELPNVSLQLIRLNAEKLGTPAFAGRFPGRTPWRSS